MSKLKGVESYRIKEVKEVRFNSLYIPQYRNVLGFWRNISDTYWSITFNSQHKKMLKHPYQLTLEEAKGICLEYEKYIKFQKGYVAYHNIKN